MEGTSEKLKISDIMAGKMIKLRVRIHIMSWVKIWLSPLKIKILDFRKWYPKAINWGQKMTRSLTPLAIDLRRICLWETLRWQMTNSKNNFRDQWIQTIFTKDWMICLLTIIRVCLLNRKFEMLEALTKMKLLYDNLTLENR